MNIRACLICALLTLAISAAAPAQETLELDLETLNDKIRGGWAGQMVGVAYGYPVEFRALMETYEGDLPWDKDMMKPIHAQQRPQQKWTEWATPIHSSCGSPSIAPSFSVLNNPLKFMRYSG